MTTVEIVCRRQMRWFLFLFIRSLGPFLVILSVLVFFDYLEASHHSTDVGCRLLVAVKDSAFKPDVMPAWPHKPSLLQLGLRL